ncbi:MAG: hypothetical protein LBH35_03200 [Treponema sp.]|jgi:hypothetical protein|nr:hypothetical protein [Treponema sp.]
MDFRRLLFLIAFLPALLCSQENSVPGEDASYFIEYDSGIPKFTQRLSWYPEEYASFYELSVEEASAPRREVLRATTRESHIDISLPPGLYRYRIRAYDLFEKPVGNPPWAALEILPALQPELLEAAPEPFDKNAESVSVSLRGRGIAEDARIVLKNKKTGGEREGVLYAGSMGNTGRAVFSPPPERGNYDLVVTNPGGLRDSFGPLFLDAKQAKKEYYVSTGYKPVFSLYGELNEMLGTRFYPLGFGARLWSVPFRLENFDLGFEAAADYGFLASDYSEGGFDYRVTGHLAGLGLRVLIQKQFSEHVSARFHAGPGITAALDFKKENPLFSTDSIKALFPTAGAGIAVSFHFSRSLFVMLSLEYLHLFSSDKTDPGYLSPYLGIGFAW